MPKFISTDRVAVSDEAGNTVYVRRKMDMGTQLRAQEAFANGEGLIALYKFNILAWEGPDFKGIRCTPENIEKLDPDDPFWVKVGDKIADLNPKLLGDQTPDPLASTTDGGGATTASQPSESDSLTTK